jgi:HAD superfamily 5'-nucleotidase-like hydrolase
MPVTAASADRESSSTNPTGSPPPTQRVFANRTLNLRGVPAIGYDMDYTLIHYRVEEWEGEAFRTARDILARRGWPVADLEFDPSRFTLGLTFDLELGNLVKATRFGYVVRAWHGDRMLGYEQLRDLYGASVVELSEPRFRFMNTLFELSRAALFTQAVALHDAAPLPGVTGYGDIYREVDTALGETHLTGHLKADIVADPDRFVDLDPEVVPTLLDQRRAGKQLLLITNSDWEYTRRMMAYAHDRFCPDGTTWRDLFDVVIVSANKPGFFAKADPIYRVIDEDRSLLQPHAGLLEPGAVYFGGNARLVEQTLAAGRSSGPSGAVPLYVGDHLFGDVHVTKDVLRWRTALIVRELEDEIADTIAFAADEQRLRDLMVAKVDAEHHLAVLRTARRRDQDRAGGEPPASGDGPTVSRSELDRAADAVKALDDQVAPLARAASALGNQTWGPLMRSGNDKSLFARQVERYADVYTSRVSNFRHATPYGYLRASRGSLPHDEVTRLLDRSPIDDADETFDER